MSNFPPNREPRSDVVMRHTAAAIDADALKVYPFSKLVAERYLSTTVERCRVVSFKDPGTDAEQVPRAEKHNHKTVDRYLRRDLKTFPADLEDAWVESLPQPYRRRCEIELAARRGHALVRDPLLDVSPNAEVGDLSALLREVGETAIAAAPIFADGQVTRSDAPHLPQALACIRQLMAAALQLHQRLSAELVDTPAADNVMPLRAQTWDRSSFLQKGGAQR